MYGGMGGGMGGMGAMGGMGGFGANAQQPNANANAQGADTNAQVPPLPFPAMNPFMVPPPGPQQPPEQRFAVQLQQLQDMGFSNRAVNVQELQVTGGNVEAAVARLLDRN